jgi:molecular chaperone DnaJ
MTHYDVLGITPEASRAEVRDAYRRLARTHHPDRAVAGSAAPVERSMPEINEAYRVLHDPGRRAVYDASLRSGGPPTADRPAPPPPDVASAPPLRRDGPPYRGPVSVARDFRPGRIPWRLVIGGVVATVAGLAVLSLLTEPAAEPTPDGILRVGDCVEYQPDGDAAEVPCTGADDLVVRAFIPFDGTCPLLTEPHRDQQGMGVACVEPLSADAE